MFWSGRGRGILWSLQRLSKCFSSIYIVVGGYVYIFGILGLPDGCFRGLSQTDTLPQPNERKMLLFVRYVAFFLKTLLSCFLFLFTMSKKCLTNGRGGATLGLENKKSSWWREVPHVERRDQHTIRLEEPEAVLGLIFCFYNIYL